MIDLERLHRQLTVTYANETEGTFNSSVLLIVTIIYMTAILSISVYEPQKLIWLGAYPIVASEILGIGYWSVFKKSLWIIPLVALVGMFNPVIDTATAFTVGDLNISNGWVSFFSILLRGLLSLQALVILISKAGFIELFNSLRRIGCPNILVTQLQLTYRYTGVIIEEGINMKRSIAARGYGKKSYPLSMWSRFIGLLLIRSFNRASRVNKAMKARGFNGTFHTGRVSNWNTQSWLWLLSWTTIIIFLRFINFSLLITKVIIHQ